MSLMNSQFQKNPRCLYTLSSVHVMPSGQYKYGTSPFFIMRTHTIKSMASGPLKIKKGTRPVLILATHRHTTESVAEVAPEWICYEKHVLFPLMLVFYQMFST